MSEKEFSRKAREILTSKRETKYVELMELVNQLPCYMSINTEDIFPGKTTHQERLLDILAKYEHLISPKLLSFGSNVEKGAGRFKVLRDLSPVRKSKYFKL